MGCDSTLYPITLGIRRFNPRTRMGCDNLCCAFGQSRFVSIHAPAWGATFAIRLRFPLWLFQSTHPHGVRPHIPKQCADFSDVSIHAPAWGATYTIIINIRFLSTHPHGVRLFIMSKNSLFTLFQSTHPHGVRRCFATPQSASLAVSIHAPAWGATQGGHTLTPPYQFQSTHPHGVRHEEPSL